MKANTIIKGVLISAGGFLVAAAILSTFQDVPFVDKLRQAFDR